MTLESSSSLSNRNCVVDIWYIYVCCEPVGWFLRTTAQHKRVRMIASIAYAAVVGRLVATQGVRWFVQYYVTAPFPIGSFARSFHDVIHMHPEFQIVSSHQTLHIIFFHFFFVQHSLTCILFLVLFYECLRFLLFARHSACADSRRFDCQRVWVHISSIAAEP